MHHHEHALGCFIAWLCADCSKAEITHAVQRVARGLKDGRIWRLFSYWSRPYKCVSMMRRIRHHGEWRNLNALQLNRREARAAAAVRLMYLETGQPRNAPNNTIHTPLCALLPLFLSLRGYVLPAAHRFKVRDEKGRQRVQGKTG